MEKVFITGASSGLGQAIGKQLCSDFEIHNFSRTPSPFINHTLDLADNQSPNQLYDEYIHLKPNIIILNAGIKLGNWINKSNIDDLSLSMKINFEFNAQFLTLAYDELIKNNTKILVITSIVSYINGATQSYYAASKHALRSFMESIQTETKYLFGEKYRNFKIFAPSYIEGTRMTPSLQNNVQKFADLAINFLFNTNDVVFIPNWDSIFKSVKAKYDIEPIQQGLDSIEYKKKNNRL